MPILITSGSLLIGAAAIAVLRVLRPRFRFSWLVAVTVSAAAWLSVWLWVPGLPVSLSIPLWKSVSSANTFATFAANGVTWPFACALATLGLSVILTAPARRSFPNSPDLALCLAISGVGILAVAADGPLTLVLIWAGLDLIEAGRVLARAEDRSSTAQVPFAFTVRLASMALILLALVLGESGQGIASFFEIRGASLTLLPAAAILRLAAFAVPWPGDSTTIGSDDIGALLQLVAGASSIVFLSHVSPESHYDSPGLAIACSAAALYASWMWLRAPDQQLGRSVWVMGIGNLAVAAALRGNPTGVTGWGSAMILAGGALFLSSSRERWTSRGLLLGLWLISALPFAPTATAWVGGGGVLELVLPAQLLVQGMMLAGYGHHASRIEVEKRPLVEMASLRGIYRAGIALPLATGILLGMWGWPGAFRLGAPLAGAVAVGLGFVLSWSKRRFAALNPIPTRWFPAPLGAALSLVRRELARLDGAAQRAGEALTQTLEGEVGIMWSLLFLVLLVSLIASRIR